MSRSTARWRWMLALRESTLTSTERHVALAFALRADANGGSCFPGPATIGRDTGYDIRTVKRARSTLIEAGWLVELERGGMVGSERVPSSFVLSIPATGGTESPVSESSATGDTRSRPRVTHGHPTNKRLTDTDTNGGAAVGKQLRGVKALPDCLDCFGHGWVIDAGSNEARRCACLGVVAS